MSLTLDYVLLPLDWVEISPTDLSFEHEHIQTSPQGLGTTTIPAHQGDGLSTGEITPRDDIS